MEELSQSDIDWINKQDKKMDEGMALIKRASDEALDYAQDALENMSDRAWRKMVIKSQALEMGIGIGMAEHLVPSVYSDMKKSLHKRIKVDKKTAMALRHIYIGRVIKNLIKELENGR